MRTEVEFDDVSDGVGGVDRVVWTFALALMNPLYPSACAVLTVFLSVVNQASLTNPVFEDEDGGTIGSVDDHVPVSTVCLRACFP